MTSCGMPCGGYFRAAHFHAPIFSFQCGQTHLSRLPCVALICVDRRSSYVVDFLANDGTKIPGKVFIIALRRQAGTLIRSILAELA
jgi:hypothetical protein